VTDAEALVVITYLEARFPRPDHRDKGSKAFPELGTCWKSIYDEYTDCEDCKGYLFAYKLCQELRNTEKVLAE
jgi:hypothetical protein